MNINDILEKKWVIPTGVGVTCSVLGFGAGVYLGIRKERNRISNRLYEIKDNMNIMSADEYAELCSKNDELLEEGDIVVFENSESITLTIPENDKEKVTVNVFANPDTWDDELEKANRVDGEPYIIPLDVFIENENDWTQHTLTYYAGDNIVADEADTPIYNYSASLGDLKFGHGSQDPNVVYIRNEDLRREWEVLKHNGYFQVEVAGLEIEHQYEEQDIKHSNDRKFRSD